jgi:cytoskeletal protein RodZ
MKNAGAVLKAERLRKNKTIREISRTTKISMLTLETLEGEHEDLNPPATYARGFLRAYALELELDPDEILSIYDQGVKEKQKAGPAKKTKDESPRIPGYLVPVILGAVLLLACALYFGYMGRSSDTPRQAAVDVAEQEQQKEPEQQNLQTPPMVQEAPVAQPADTAPAADTGAGHPFTVRFVAGERTWMRFTVDDRHVFDALLKPDEVYSVNAVANVKVRIGNPAGLKAFYNDSPVPVTGRRGAPVTLSFPVANDVRPAR